MNKHEHLKGKSSIPLYLKISDVVICEKHLYNSLKDLREIYGADDEITLDSIDLIVRINE